MAKITIVGDILCSPRMTEIAKGDYSSLFAKALKKYIKTELSL